MLIGGAAWLMLVTQMARRGIEREERQSSSEEREDKRDENSEHRRSNLWIASGMRTRTEEDDDGEANTGQMGQRGQRGRDGQPGGAGQDEHHGDDSGTIRGNARSLRRKRLEKRNIDTMGDVGRLCQEPERNQRRRTA